MFIYFLLVPELKGELGWCRLNFYQQSFCEDPVQDNVERISCKEVDEQEFIERFERPGRPTVITGCQDSWDAKKKWTLEVMFGCISACP